MKLIDLKESAPRGTYFGVKPTKETITAIQEFMGEHRIPNPVTEEDMHATVVYSRAFVGAKPLGDLEPAWKASFSEFDVFPSSSEDDEEPNNCLVMKFNCPEIEKRHKFLRKEHGATHDFPTFDAHVTLSYDAGDFDIDNLPDYEGPFEFGEEYSEPLTLNWSSK